MKIIHSILTLTFVWLIFSHNVNAASRRREDQKIQEDLDKAKQEVLLYQNQLEEVRIKRWQDKRNAVAAQEAFNEAWNEVKTEIDRLGQTKDQKEESLLRLQNQESQKAKEVDEQVSRLKQFGLQVRDKLNELGKEWEIGFPYRAVEKLSNLSMVKKEFEKSDPASFSGLNQLFNLAYGDFVDGETRSIVRDKLAIKGLAGLAGMDKKGDNKIAASSSSAIALGSQAKIAAGYIVRLGQAYQAFVSTEGEDVAILGKTGRLDGQAWEWIEEIPENVRKNLHASILELVQSQDKSLDAAKAAGNTHVTDISKELSLLPMDVLLTKATGEGFTTKTHNTFLKTIEHEFDGGGWVMWPIMGLMLAGILIVIERVIVFLRKDQDALKLSKKVQLLVSADQIPQAIQLCKKRPGSVSRVLLGILERSNGSREDAESKAHEIMLHECPALEKRITTMNILAAASPLVGLLGTVTGMVRLFDVITVHGTGNPKLMADGISEALIATKWGLGVAIPMLLAYNLLDNWSGSIVADMEKYAAKLVNILFKTSKRVEEPV